MEKRRAAATALLDNLFGKDNYDLIFVCLPGLDMVSGASVAHFHLTKHQFGTSQINGMVKIAPGIGPKERHGADLLRPHLPIPDEFELGMAPRGDDYYLYYRISGQTVDQWLKRDPSAGQDFYLGVVADHVDMWKDTRGTLKPIGYFEKIAHTKKLTFQFELGGQSLESLSEKPIIVNGVKIPCLRDCLDEMGRVISTGNTTILSHGDEALCNAIVCRHSNRIFHLDHGTVGNRLLAEPIAKLLLWFPATLSEKTRLEFDIGNELKLDYAVKIDPMILNTVLTARQYIMDHVGDLTSPTQIQACMMMYLLRELQWISRRGRELMMAPLFAMAMESAGGMLGILPDFPLFGQEGTKH
ncbi:MAG: hypothetical protein ABIH38_04540 [Patescibacteria group bacterium]